MNKRLFQDQGQADCPSSDTVSGNGQSHSTSSGQNHLAILLVDDRPEVATAIEIAFRLAGHELTVAVAPEEAFSQLALRKFDAIVLDLNFTAGKSDGQEGLACLTRIIADDPGACVVVLTAHGGIRTAVAAMQAGARDFAMKPWKNSELIAKVEGATTRLPHVEQASSPEGVAHSTVTSQPLGRLLGESDAIVALREIIRKVGPTMAGVTVTGPSGSGRTLTALCIQASSGATSTPLQIDLRDEAAWSALQGAHGSAILRHPDRLDELAQDRLLRQIPDKIRPIAIVDSLTLLKPRLRRRIATVELAVPPLSARSDDISLLARHFVRVAAERFGRLPPVLTEAALSALRAADWPDEVRGLAAAMERAVLLSEEGMIDTATLSLGNPPAGTSSDVLPPANAANPDFDLDRSEKAIIAAALAENRHNISHTATALGLSRGALYRRMERYGL